MNPLFPDKLWNYKNFNMETELDIAFLGDDEAQIELIHDINKDTIDIGKDISWAFSVDSVEDMYQFAKKQNIIILSEIIEPMPSAKFFH